MSMTGFICHDEYYKKTHKLTDEQLGRLFRACMIYHSTGEEPELDGIESIAFDFIKEDIDKSEKAYQEKCETNRKNRLTKTTTDNDRQQPSTDENDRQRPSIIKDNIKEIKEEDKEKELEKEIYKEKESKPEPQKRFIPPTVEEVSAYCKERNNGIDAEYFVAYYTTRNWVMTNGKKMVNWKAAVITWEKNNFSKGGSSSQTKKVNAQQYSQRDYGDKDDDVVKRLLRMNGGETA